jgi:hypothetical protein
MGKWIRAVVFSVFLSGSILGTARAAEPPAGFVQSEPLVTSCTSLATGVRVGVRNETASRRKVRVGLVLIGEDGRRVKARRVCGGLTPAPRKMKLRPGGLAVVTLRGPTPKAQGTFSGSLALFGRRGRVARRELTISNEPAAGSAELAAVPLVSSVSKAVHDTSKGPVWIPVEGSNSELPSATKGEKGIEATTVGALTGPGDPVSLVYRGESEALAKGASEVGIELDGDLSPGTYSGRVDLSPDDPEKGEVSLELKVSAEEWIAILALLAGIVFGVMLLRISGRTVPRARLLGRADALTERYEAVENELLRAGGSGTWNQLVLADLGTRKSDLEDEIRTNTKWWKVLVQIEKTVVGKFEESIKSLEGEIDLLRTVPKHAHLLEAVLLQQGALPLHLPPLPDTSQAAAKPAIEVKAEELLKKAEIPVAELRSRLDEMDNRAKQVRRLRDLERKLEEHWRRVKDRIGNQAQRIKERLGICRRRLWEAEDEEALTWVNDQLEKAAEELVQLDPQMEDAPGPVDVLAIAQPLQVGIDMPLTFALTAPPAGAAFGALVPQAPVGSPIPAEQAPLAVRPLTEGGATKAVQRALALQFLVVVVAAALALASGLELLYVGKTWGTFWDVLAAVVWGIGATAVTTTLVTSLDNLGSLAALWRRS